MNPEIGLQFGYRRLLETMASYQTGEARIVLPEMWDQTAKKNAAGDGINNAERGSDAVRVQFHPRRSTGRIDLSSTSERKRAFTDQAECLDRTCGHGHDTCRV